jgi:4,5-dihydroxyphthalate decarboxylase
MKRMENPRVAPLAWYREAWEEQEEIMGSDPFEYGMTEKNEKQLNLLAKYSFEQGISSKHHSLDELFLKVDQGRKRGHVFRV